jgi:tetratricopeptide (TPR) repeat protein
MRRLLLIAVLLQSTTLVAQSSRMASDFEIAQMEKQLARFRDFASQLSARLNLGDLRATRNERSLARTEYTTALATAERERLNARRDSAMTRYAQATSYAALAQAKLGRDGEAFRLLEESVRYTADDAETWNLYASAMTVLHRPLKAASAARNAVAIAEGAVKRSPSTRTRLDLAIYEYALAAALTDANANAEAERALTEVTQSLRSKAFDELRETVAREESFEIYSSARGDAAAYVSLLNRAQLRLGTLYEQRGDAAAARTQFERVLRARSDDATALAALARLATSDEERERRYAEAFDANPFSEALVREYRRSLGTRTPAALDTTTTGGQMRRALVQLARGERRAAQQTLDALLAKHPASETLRALRRETEATTAFAMPSATPTGEELRRVVDALAAERVTAEERAALDAATFTSAATFDAPTPGAAGQTLLASGTIEGVPFRFATPTAFTGTFDTTQPLTLTYRILGAADVLLLEPLLLEPLKVEATR